MADLQNGSLTECPVCGSDSIEGQGFDCDGDSVWQKVYCFGCGYGWLEVFKFSQNENMQAQPLTEEEINEEKGLV